MTVLFALLGIWFYVGYIAGMVVFTMWFWGTPDEMKKTPRWRRAVVIVFFPVVVATVFLGDFRRMEGWLK